jgi:DNA topoisomerase-1
MSLLIVESPAKGRKIQKFLQGTGITVSSSFGHINNLDTEKLDAMITNNFTPIYKSSNEKSKVIKELKALGKGKDIILAADDDREGDAIAWHCGNLFKTDYTKNNRITFNEISKKAIEKALQNRHTLNMNSVNSQRCRQLLDLMIGYKLSPLLWKHIKTQEKGLSAGRVQSTLLRMLKEHEDKINKYEPDSSYDFTGKLRDVDDKERILDCIFHISDEYYELIDALDCNEILTLFKHNRVFHVSHRHETQDKKSPPQPFITSTLQQVAQNELGFPIKMTMDIAQKLYENGKITYMRTDSTFIADEFKTQIKNKVIQDYGSEYYKHHKPKKVKGAQEAHECIRPTDLHTVLSDGYTDKDKKLYQLILKRTITSHMKQAIYDVCKIDLMNDITRNIGYYQGTTKSLAFEGFLKYTGATIEKKTSFDSIQSCTLIESEIKETESNPPQYYNESTIVKKLEASGVGRPSTYASIISTLYSRKYTLTKDIVGNTKEEPYYKLDSSDMITKGTHTHAGIKQKKRIQLTDLGETVLDYLLKHFNDMICIQFTAQVETDLDKITNGTIECSSILKKIYDVYHPIVIDQMRTTSIGKETIQLGIYEIRTGRYGPYILHNKETYGLSAYLTMQKKKVTELSVDDLDTVIKYPKKVGKYNRKSITLHIGQHSIYMKYDGKNYRVDKLKDHSLESLSSLISR